MLQVLLLLMLLAMSVVPTAPISAQNECQFSNTEFHKLISIIGTDNTDYEATLSPDYLDDEHNCQAAVFEYTEYLMDDDNNEIIDRNFYEVFAIRKDDGWVYRYKAVSLDSLRPVRYIGLDKTRDFWDFYKYDVLIGQYSVVKIDPLGANWPIEMTVTNEDVPIDFRVHDRSQYCGYSETEIINLANLEIRNPLVSIYVTMFEDGKGQLNCDNGFAFISGTTVNNHGDYSEVGAYIFMHDSQLTNSIQLDEFTYVDRITKTSGGYQYFFEDEDNEFSIIVEDGVATFVDTVSNI